MMICIAYLHLTSGTQAILRGTPEDVSDAVVHSSDAAGGGEIRCTVQGDVKTIYEENDLWLNFIAEAGKVGLVEVAKLKHQLWRRKGGFLWHVLDTPKYLCFFMLHNDQMILRDDPREQH